MWTVCAQGPGALELFLGEPGGTAGTEAGVGRGWGWGGAGLSTPRAPWLEAAGDSAAILVRAPGLCRQGVGWLDMGQA